MKITILVGLPGSGKTTLGNQISTGVDTFFIDDISVSGGLVKLLDIIKSGYKNIIISDVFLCRDFLRNNAAKWLAENVSGYEINWIYFENAPEKCLKNVSRRNQNGDTREVNGLIKTMTHLYTIPEGVDVRLVFDE